HGTRLGGTETRHPRDPGIRRPRAIRESRASSLLQRYGLPSRVLSSVSRRERDLDPRRDLRGRRRWVQSALRRMLSSAFENRTYGFGSQSLPSHHREILYAGTFAGEWQVCLGGPGGPCVCSVSRYVDERPPAI